MGGGDALQKSMAVLAAVKKGMSSVSELRDRCNDAIKAGVDVNGVAERQRVPVGGVHGRDYMKLVRDDVKLRLKEHAEKEGKRLPGFGRDDDDKGDTKRLALGAVDGDAPLRLGDGDAGGERLALGDGKERRKGRAASTSRSDDGVDDVDVAGMSKAELVDAVLRERKRGAGLKRRLGRMGETRKKKRKKGRKDDDRRRRKSKGKKSKSRRRSSSSSSSSSSEEESESDSDDRRYDHISGKVIKLRRKSSKVDDRLEYNRAKTLRILNFAYND